MTANGITSTIAARQVQPSGRRGAHRERSDQPDAGGGGIARLSIAGP